MTAPVIEPIIVHAPPGEEALLTVPEVCAWLRIARSVLHEMKRDGELEPIKIRGSVRYPISRVRAYLYRQVHTDAA